jgi:chromosome segregation ATPase
MSKKTRTLKNQSVKSKKKNHQGGKLAAKKKGGLAVPGRDFESDLRKSQEITKLKDQIDHFSKERDNNLQEISELRADNAKQAELRMSEKNAHVLRLEESESENQMLKGRCDELASRLRDEQITVQDCHRALVSKEENVQALREELSRTQWCLGEEKAFRQKAEEAARQKQEELQRHADEMCMLSDLRKERSDLQWYLGEEKTLRQKAERSLGEAAASIERQQNDLKQKQSDLEAVTKQFQDSQWSLGEAQEGLRTLEEQLLSENKRSRDLSVQITEMQAALAKSNLLAAEWMRRWDRLIEEALKSGGEIDREQIENGKLIERQLSLARQEVDALTATKAELEEQSRQVVAATDDLLNMNADLQKELLSERQKYQALEKNYSESEWYLKETRAEIQRMKGSAC